MTVQHGIYTIYYTFIWKLSISVIKLLLDININWPIISITKWLKCDCVILVYTPKKTRKRKKNTHKNMICKYSQINRYVVNVYYFYLCTNVWNNISVFLYIHILNGFKGKSVKRDSTKIYRTFVRNCFTMQSFYLNVL